MSTDLEYKIARLELKRGDLLVVKIDSLLLPETARRAHNYFKGVLPADRGIEVLIIDKNTDLSVLTADEIAKLTKA